MDSPEIVAFNVEPVSDLIPKEIAKELYIAIKENQMRGLIDNQVFFAEMLHCLNYKLDPAELQWRPPTQQVELVKLLQSLLALDEWKRAEFHSRSLDTQLIAFIHFWARLQRAELDARGLQSANNLPFSGGYETRKTFNKILEDLEAYPGHQEDGFLNYIRAKVLVHLRRKADAREVLLTSINQVPCNWLAWTMLHKFVDCKETLADISALLCRHWLKRLFLADVRCAVLPLAQDEDVTDVYKEMLDIFKDSPYILTQMAIKLQSQRQVCSAIQLFRQVRSLDPYRLQQLDVYSNLLYVVHHETELTYLAHFCADVNKYCKETCAIIANFLSLRGQHEKAVEYYRRALKLDPEYSQGWTLMGHECLEIKDTTSAIEAYRQATNINERDYHAWYGLGQLFEVLKMPYFALRYHQKAHSLRPSDSRILVAMADCYQKLGEMDDAKKCFYKAYQTGDIEGMVLHNLARLHEELGEKELALECFRKFLEECDERKLTDVEEQGDAFLYLARAYLEEGKLDDALIFAQKGFGYAQRREESKMIIKLIAAARDAEGGNGHSNVTAIASGSGAEDSAPTFKFTTPKSSGATS
ncbi:cell division cycle protein 23 homolog isoform X2 [Varroa jacobsoni]|uniref:Cdc23 domain-containing protein n=1 Tax=Varroa destructor TaxID=109461 RepID=A0A7M7JVW8_VARDE|nr:cell division cycle protein 23 homolog isoform X2 [Varroa destructor]XP_022701135.1 cell division cycle protein 23 homolog isoform X2 [Varroa jacobsoni]